MGGEVKRPEEFSKAASNENGSADRMLISEFHLATRRLVADYLEGRTAEENPGLLYVTGIHGAGKADFAAFAQQQPNFSDYFVRINAEDLHAYHPRYASYVREEPLTAAARVEPDVSHMLKWLCEEAAEKRVNVVLVDAPRSLEKALSVITPFVEMDYSVDAAVLIAQPVLARQDLQMRFLEELSAAKNGEAVMPRWVDVKTQDKAQAALVEIVRTIEEEGFARTLAVLDRNYQTVYLAQGRQFEPRADVVVKESLERDMTRGEVLTYQANSLRIKELEQSLVQPQKTAVKGPVSKP
jgi:hypothetical protein